MKRVTVAVTLGDYWYCSADDMRKIRQAMIAAAVEKCGIQGVTIESIEAKAATNVRRKK